MADLLLDKLAGIEARYDELERMISDPVNVNDYEKIAELAQERAEIADIVAATREYRQALDELEQAQALIDDPDMAELAREEVAEQEKRIAELENSLRRMLLPRDPRDEKNVIMEIRAGTGGDEAGLFAAVLFRMYSRYAENHGWKIDVLSANETGVGGYKEIVFAIKGRGAYSRLKFESGVHRVQRVPVTESQGRIHTSTATVAVLAEMEEVDIEIDPKDLQIDTYRSAGAGGQNVQKNETAVRITHLPTGLVVSCQNERSQTQNKERAMQVLKMRLLDLERRKQEEEFAELKGEHVSAGWGNAIRSYVLHPYQLVKDTRTGHESGNTQAVLDGDLDDFMEAYLAARVGTAAS